jgi:HlyD family secretion protein
MPMLSRSRLLWLAAPASLILASGTFLWSSHAKVKPAPSPSAAASPYAAIANGKADVEGGVVQVAARTSGIVDVVMVQEGDHVRRGQALARLEDNEARLAASMARAEVGQAQARMEPLLVEAAIAKREYERLERLAARNVVAGQRLDQAADSLRAAEANIVVQRAAISMAETKLAQAQHGLELTVVRAPAGGRIIRRYANPGSGASTLNVSNMFDLEPETSRIVRAELPESALSAVFVGQGAQLSPETDLSRTYEGEVLRSAAVFGARKLQSDDPTERADDRVVEVVVSSRDAPFLVGQRVLVKFLKAPRRAPDAPHGQEP